MMITSATVGLYEQAFGRESERERDGVVGTDRKQLLREKRQVAMEVGSRE